MLVFPNCKINLGLHVIRKRPDGFHDLETVFYPLPFFDALELIPQIPENPENFLRVDVNGCEIYFATSGIEIPGKVEDNIVLKACRLILKKNHPPFQIHLHKKIPMGAGLGGGSANGAFMLQLLDETFKINLHKQKLREAAKTLGSDCPFFLENKPVFATGTGDITENISIDLSGYSLLLIYPGIPISTVQAYAEIEPSAPATSIQSVIRRPVTEWKDQLVNVFEKVAFQLHPELSAMKTMLYEKGAVYASMTGSGSAMYALFPAATPPALKLPENSQSWFLTDI